MYKSVLVATDGSPTASEAVRVATELAKTFAATLHIANVYRTGEGSVLSVPGFTLGYPEGIDLGSVAETETESAAALARSKGVAAETHVATGNVADAIVSIAKEHGVELIVVGNKGMRGVKRVLGSVPNAVAHRAPCAVLIVNTT